MSPITKEFTKEQLQQIIETDHVQCGEASSLARIALASLEAKSRKLFTCSGCGAEGLDEPLESKCHCNEDGAHWVESVVYSAPPAPVSVPEPIKRNDADGWWMYKGRRVGGGCAEWYNRALDDCRAAMLQGAEPVKNHDELREKVRREHAEWSQATFGDVGPVGPLKHLSKEALEAAAEPRDLSEWADMQFLLWDAQRRAGISDGEITAAMEEKLKVNMARQWPEPKDGEPRLHIKAAPQQEVTQALAKGMEHYGDAMQKLADSGD